MALTVVEVMRRSEQGITRPYVCRCDDGEIYFVKGRAATRRGLVAELLSGCLAISLGLPVAHFDIAEIPEELQQVPGLHELGRGPAFASRRVVAAEFTRTEIIDVPPTLRYDVLCFDWWIRNGDRQLSDRGGNPNLLWQPRGEGQLTVIDHNLAFDDNFDVAAFTDGHVFHDDIFDVFEDVDHRMNYTARFHRALGAWDAAVARIPQSWFFIDEEQTIPSSFSIDAMRACLDRAFTPEFWDCQVA